MEAAAVSAVVSMILKVVGNKLGPLLVKEYNNIVGVKTDLCELRDQVEDINNWLETRDEAIWNDHGPSFNWLKRMKDVAYDLDDVVDELQLKAEKHEAGDGDGDGGLMSKYMFKTPKSFILECKVAGKIKTIRKRLAVIVNQRAAFITIANSLQVAHSARHMNETIFEMSSLPIVDVASVLGRDQDKDKIITELVKSNGQQERVIISVIGLGGSGKTTLAKLIFSDTETLKNHFDFKLWVHVSQEFNVGSLIKKLFEALTKEKSDKNPLQHISEEISKRLNGKKFLLVLDDVWTGEEIEWEQFMVHLKSGAPESKILVTTRSRRVAEAMESIYIFDLPFLSFDDSWQLFHHSFGAGVTGLSPEFQELGKEIVRKCGGVPLAIKSLAGVLRGMEGRIDDWQAMRDNNLLDVQGGEHRVAACLRLSYSHLQCNLKQCFTICSVFPKGHKIDKEQLIDLWIAHDMISMDYIGNKHFNSLVQISFLQNVEEEEGGRVTCTMHDLVHDLAQLILVDEISLIIPMEEENSTKSYRYFSLREQPEVIVPKNIFEKARSVYITKCYDHIFGIALEKAKHLRSVTVGSPYVTALPNAVFQIKNLKYLSMSRLNCEELPDAISDVWSLQALHITDSLYLLRLPESIGKLKKLKTLNLSGCQYLNRLPYSIGDCHMISNIDLWCCIDLAVLPDSIGRNKELRVLRLGCTRLWRLPSIITLENLECLDLTRCYRLVELPEGIWNLKKLRVLRLGSTRLRRLPSIITLENLECLDLTQCDELVELPEGIWNLKKLEVLNIERCRMFGCPLVLNRRTLDRVQNMNIFVAEQGKRSAVMLQHACITGTYEYDSDQSFAHTYVIEPDDAQMTCLKQKTNLQCLNLRGMTHGMAEVNNEFVKAVLDDLEPPSGIKELGVCGYSGRQSTWWMQNKVGGGVQGPAPFPFLRVLKLSSFPKLKNLHGLVELPCLEELELQQMPSLESISGGPFPSLVKLGIHKLRCLGEVWMVGEGTMPDGEEEGGCCNFTPQLGQVRVGSRLTELRISYCPKLEVKPHFPVSLENLWLNESSNYLLLSPCQGQGSSSSSNSQPSFSHLKVLELWCMKASSPFSQPPSPGLRLELLQHMSALVSLDIFLCSDVIELPNYLGNLSSLQRMSIRNCNLLRGLPQSTGHLTSLQELIVGGCHAFVQFPESLGELRSLNTFEIYDLHVLTCFPESLWHLTSLEVLIIRNCKELVQLPEGLGKLCSLSKLDICWLPGLTCLPQSLCGLLSLQQLIIGGCKVLHELPECLGELHRLRKLEIWELDSIICLPQSLCRLTTSLRELGIWSCPGIKAMPEWIKGLTALQRLMINSCPDLQRRCKRGNGEDWHLISHIPDVFIG